VKSWFKFQSLGKISNISTSDTQFFYVNSNREQKCTKHKVDDNRTSTALI